MRPWTFDEVRTVAQDIVAEKGEDYVYRRPSEAHGARYVHVSLPEPGCLIGHILHRFGVPLISLLEQEHLSVDRLLTSLRICADSRIVQWLLRAQGLQDAGVQWGTALRHADEYVEYYDSMVHSQDKHPSD